MEQQIKDVLEEHELTCCPSCGCTKYYIYFDNGAEYVMEQSKITSLVDWIDYLYIRVLCAECDKQLIYTEFIKQ